MELRKTFRFEASHVLPKHPGKCSRLHGHSWVLHVFVKGPINPETGFVMDYAEISKVVKPLIEDLDHHHLGAWEVWKGDVAYQIHGNLIWGVPWLPSTFYPSSENLLFVIGLRLVDLDWSKLALEETCTSYAELTREEFLTMGPKNA
jgi:queuosine biosynthesis protein QueD